MSWDDSDDDWEASDLKIDDGKKDEETWSDEEGHDLTKAVEETKKPVPVPTPAPPKPKTGLELKIEQREKREKEEAERKAAAAKKVEEELNLEGMDSVMADKVRRQKLEEAADLDAAIDSFGPSGESKPKETAERRGPVLGSFDEFEPKTDADFEKLGDMMSTKLTPHQDTKGHMLALKAILRGACANMSTDDCKDLSSFVAVLSNDKIKADREKDKKGKSKGKSKGKINIAASKAADNDMDDIGSGGGGGWGGGGGGRDDEYDFM